MTAPLPDRRVEPLPPPPGSFDAVVGRARERRYRRLTAVTTISGVFLAGVLGGVGLAGGVTGVSERLAGVVNYARVTTTTSADPDGPTSSTKASRVPNPGKRSAAPPATSSPVRRTRAPGPAALVRGRVVDPAGAPVAGLFVWTGRLTGSGFVPSATPAATTGTDGRFAVACTGGPVLLTSWKLGVALPATQVGRWAATLTAEARCTRSTAAQDTTVTPGGVLTGTVRTDVPCPGVEFALSVQVPGVATPVRLTGLSDGDQYRLAGVPTGFAVVGGPDHRTTVRLTDASALQQDVTLTCPAAPTPSDTPTDTTSPSPSPSPTLPASTSTPSTGSPSPSSTVTAR